MKYSLAAVFLFLATTAFGAAYPALAIVKPDTLLAHGSFETADMDIMGEENDAQAETSHCQCPCAPWAKLGGGPCGCPPTYERCPRDGCCK